MFIFRNNPSRPPTPDLLVSFTFVRLWIRPMFRNQVKTKVLSFYERGILFLSSLFVCLSGCMFVVNLNVWIVWDIDFTYSTNDALLNDKVNDFVTLTLTFKLNVVAESLVLHKYIWFTLYVNVFK